MKGPKASLTAPPKKRANIGLLNVEIWSITILRRFIHIHLLHACIRCLSKPLAHIFAEDGDDPEDAWISDDEEDEDAKYLGPTCTKDGVEYRECIYPGCEYVETRVVKALS